MLRYKSDAETRFVYFHGTFRMRERRIAKHRALDGRTALGDCQVFAFALLPYHGAVYLATPAEGTAVRQTKRERDV